MRAILQRLLLLVAVATLSSSATAIDTKVTTKESRAKQRKAWNDYFEMIKKRDVLQKQMQKLSEQRKKGGEPQALIAQEEAIETQIKRLDDEYERIKSEFDAIEKEPVKIRDLWEEYIRLVKKRANLEKAALTPQGLGSKARQEELDKTIQQIERVMEAIDKHPSPPKDG